MNNNIK